jgi:hypothetical protein
MGDFYILVKIFIFVLLCSVPFALYLFVMVSLHEKVGDWYVGKVKDLNKKDLSVFTVRNMASTGIILLLFFSPIILYAIFRPSFFDPSWNCLLLAGAVVSIVVFQIVQYAWLYYRARKKKLPNPK